MIVTKDNFHAIVASLKQTGSYGLDTETTGLSIEDRLFSIQISDGIASYYFNFNEMPDHLGMDIPDEYRLIHDLLGDLQPVFNNPDSTWFVHNALFDMRMLGHAGLHIKGHVHCTLSVAKQINNSAIGYSLDKCLKRAGLGEKDDKVAEYVKTHKLYDMAVVPGKKGREKRMHYEQVPFKLMTEYGLSDALNVWKLGQYQLKNLPDMGKDLYAMESKLLPVVAKMEAVGMQLDVGYTKDCADEGARQILRLKTELSSITGETYIPGPKWLKSILAKFKIPVQINPATGNPILDKKALEKIEHPLVKKLLELRHTEKFTGTYFNSFLHFASVKGVVHATPRPAGTVTGRFSYSNPNLQNVPNVVDGPDPRKCFVPREGYSFLAIDYRQQEYRLMLDYAGETNLIEAVNSGVDVHQATADLMGVQRKFAKTLNFMLLYGGGAATLAEGLGVTLAEAEHLKRLYFSKLPKVERFIKNVIGTARSRGFVFNWAGRRLRLHGYSTAYQMPNHLIQSSGADVIKHAMVKIDGMLKYWRTRLLLTIHDELLFEVTNYELNTMPNRIKGIMENIYVPFNGVKLECDVSISDKSLSKQDMKEYK